MKITRIVKMVTAVCLTATLMLAMIAPTYAGVMHNVYFRYGLKTVVVQVEDGCSALPPTDTYVPGYNFMGWVGDFTNVHSDLIILGAYDKVAAPPDPAPAPVPDAPSRTYTVRFIDTLTGAQYYQQTVSEGADANPPEIPYHSGYHFDGYDGSYTNVTSDRTIYVRYGWDYVYHNDWDDFWWMYIDTDGPGYTPNWWYD